MHFMSVILILLCVEILVIRAIFKRNPCSKDRNENKRKIEMPQHKDAHLLAQKHTPKRWAELLRLKLG